MITKNRTYCFLLFFLFSFPVYGFENYDRSICGFNFDVEKKYLFCESMCKFKFNKDKGYGYCDEKKIKKIAFVVELGSYYKLTYHLPYINKTIQESMKKIDSEVSEYKYDVSIFSSKEMVIPKSADYFFYVYVDDPNFSAGVMRVNIFKSIGDKFNFVFDDLPVSKDNLERDFNKNIDIVVNEINFEIFHKKD